MSSTVTVSTVSAVTSGVFLASFGFIIAATLLLLLIKKEIFSTSTHPWAVALAKVLNIAIVPLLMAFGLIAVINVIQMLK